MPRNSSNPIDPTLPNFWNFDPQAQDLEFRISQAAKLKVPILVVGETGSGKELVSRRLYEERRHYLGHSKVEAPFLPVNINTIPEALAESTLFGHERGAFTSARERQPGKLERAQYGTLLLDEIQNTSLSLQSKLMRIFQDLSFERLGGKSKVELKCQVICASNQPLELLVKQGKFRMDLYYRLNAFPIYIEPLRKKQAHLETIIERMKAAVSKRYGLEEKALAPNSLQKLIEYDWPGNYRELEFALLSAHLRSKEPQLQCDDLPPQINGGYQKFLDEGYWSRNASY